MRPIVLDFVRRGMHDASPRVNVNGLMCNFDPEHPDSKLIASAPAMAAELDTLRARLLAVGEILQASGCYCSCDHHRSEHTKDCARCVGCRIEAAVRS
jgi:hypothetical protein